MPASISVVLPVKNAERILGDALESLLDMDFPSERLEILVVDNGSTDSSAVVAKGMGVKVFHEPTPGPYAARNLGASKADGQIIAFTDADCRVHKDWAGAIDKACQDFDAVCGLSLGAEGGTIAKLVQQRYELNLRSRVSSNPSLPVFDTRNAAVSKTVFQEIGGFDSRLEDLADDIFGIKVDLEGGRLGFIEGMLVDHVHPESLSDISKRQIRHGRYVPFVRNYYGEDVTRYFPGINKHSWMYQDGCLASLGSLAMLCTSWGALAGFGVLVRAAVLARREKTAAGIFDLFCRAGTVLGMAEAGLRGPN